MPCETTTCSLSRAFSSSRVLEEGRRKAPGLTDLQAPRQAASEEAAKAASGLRRRQ